MYCRRATGRPLPVAGVLVEVMSCATGGAGCKGINAVRRYCRHRDTVSHRRIQAPCHGHDVLAVGMREGLANRNFKIRI